MTGTVEIRRCGPGDLESIVSAPVFDGAAHRRWTADFLSRQGHHLFVASIDGTVVGFVSGMELAHPDKLPEMLLYELGVDEPYRRKGIGRNLVVALRDEAEAIGCRGMWVPTERETPAAIATYRSAGAKQPEDAVILAWSFGAAR